jgi:hypothetical protein
MTAGTMIQRIGFMVVLVAAAASRGAAQPAETPPAAVANVVRNDSDPTRPVFFSLRPEIYSPNRDITQTALIFRYDRAQLSQRRWLPGERGVNHIFLVKAQNFSSFAGDAARADINFFLVTPTFIHTLMPSWWHLVDGETKTDWTRNNKTGVRGGLQVDHAFDRHFSLWGRKRCGTTIRITSGT